MKRIATAVNRARRVTLGPCAKPEAQLGPR